MDQVVLVDASDLIGGAPLEQPVKRRTRTPLNANEPPPTTAAPVAALPSTNVEIEFMEFEEESSAQCVSPAFPSSSAKFVECGGRGSTSKSSTQRPRSKPCHGRPSRGKNINDYSNYGSGSSDSEDDEEALVPMIVPRVALGAMDTPQDEDTPAAVDPVAAITSPPSLPPTVQEETFFPRGFFDFEWRHFPDPAISPGARREAFSQDNVGPTTPCKEPYTIFTSIWDSQIMEHITKQTNKYAQEIAELKIANNIGPKSRICLWVDTTPDELYTYFAIILAMGVVIKSKLEEYWSDNREIFSTPGFLTHMSLERFQLLNSCIHFNDNGALCVQELNPSEAKLFKIEPILTHLNKKFQEMYTLSQNITLDESLLQWKGWLSINQFISNKAASVGIKTYEICESQTGYLWRFEVHAHKKTSPLRRDQQSPLDASTPAIVLRLVNGLENKGHTLWMDSFYNSPALARWLKATGIDVVGTLRTNRQFVPEELTNLTKANMRPGQIAGYTSGDVDIMVWRDQNRVATISTYHGNTTTVVDDKVKPNLILDYNIMMGGVDKKDQMLAMYPVERKRTRVWYKKLFRRLLNISVLNSFVIAKKSASSASHRSFRRSLIAALLSGHSKPRKIALPTPRKTEVFEAKEHHLLEYPVGKCGARLRRACCQCQKRTHFYCAGCNRTVCLSSCFVALHS